MRFSIRELLLVTTIAALAIGWSLHAIRLSTLAKEYDREQAKLRLVLEIVRDTAQLNIEINDAGQVHVEVPREWPKSLADQWNPVAAPSSVPPGVEYSVLQRR